MNQISPKLLEFFHSRFIDHYGDSQSLSQVCALDDHILERVADVNEGVLSERHRANSRILKLVRDRSASSQPLAGFYILYPVNRECEGLIEDGTILNSRQMTTGHICKETEEAASLYLSMVYGKSRQAQAYLIHLLYDDIRKVIKGSQGVRAVYVRPVTAAGLKAVERHGFRRFRADSGIYRRIVSPEDVA